MAESFFKSLKTELIYGNKLISKEKMELEIFEYIEIWYNKKRRHSALNYQTIEEFNKSKQNLSKCSLTYTGISICISTNTAPLPSGSTLLPLFPLSIQCVLSLFSKVCNIP